MVNKYKYIKYKNVQTAEDNYFIVCYKLVIKRPNSL